MELVKKCWIIRNPDTGVETAVIEDLSFLTHACNNKIKYMGYYMTFPGVHEMELDKELNGEDWRVFTRLCNEMKEGGWSDNTQSGLAKALDMHQPNVSRSIVKLIERGYIARERHPANNRLTLRVSTGIAGRGKYAARKAEAAIEKQMKEDGDL